MSTPLDLCHGGRSVFTLEAASTGLESFGVVSWGDRLDNLSTESSVGACIAEV